MGTISCKISNKAEKPNRSFKEGNFLIVISTIDANTWKSEIMKKKNETKNSRVAKLHEVVPRLF